ncbi:MAG: hypothetical protein KGH59_04015 [Candidatus Micrarchaeota archaeon]|nr:hypothetical protein [Candidatus Micrarchaeota archaeon]
MAKEPKLVVRPIGRLGGLDTIHVSLLVAVAILVALLLLSSYYHPTIILPSNSTSGSNLSCAYGAQKGACVQPAHNATQARWMAEQILASYAYVNGSSSLLPYFSDTQNMTVSYVPQSKEWIATVPETNPGNGVAFEMVLTMYDSNLSLINPYIQTIRTSQVFQNRVVAKGVIQSAGKFACPQQSPLQLFWVMDPYAPGSIASLSNLTNLEARYGAKINASVKIIYGSSSTSISQAFGLNGTQALGRYTYCAAKQQNFTAFVSHLEAIYSNAYVQPSLLNQIANQSHLNMPQLNSCIQNSTQELNIQSLLVKYYNLTFTPAVITNCQYISIPQTARNAICYANSTLC